MSSDTEFQHLVLAELERQSAAITALREDVRDALRTELAENTAKIEAKIEAITVLLAVKSTNITEMRSLLKKINDDGE